MSALATNAIGTVAALCSVTSFIPQIVKMVRERDASSVSLRMYALTVCAFALWTVYGARTHAWPLVASNIAALGFSATALVLKWRFGRPKT